MTTVYFLLLSVLGLPGVCEGAAAAAVTGPSAPGGGAKDYPTAELVSSDALQKALPEYEASSCHHTGERRRHAICEFRTLGIQSCQPTSSLPFPPLCTYPASI